MQTLLFAAIAAATNMVAELPPVVVYASRVNEQSANLPQNVQVITADEESGPDPDFHGRLR